MAKHGDTSSPRHPAATLVTRLHTELDEVEGLSLLALDAAATRATLVDVHRLAARVSALQLRILAHAEDVDVAAEVGATGTAAWLAHATRQTPRVAHADTTLAAALRAPGRWCGRR